MQLDLKGASSFFAVPQKTVLSWIKTKNLPSYQVDGQYWFNRAELLEWATAQKIPLSGQIVEAENGQAAVKLEEALRLGGIFHNVGGTDKASVLGAVVDVMNLPPEIDRVTFCELLLARESLGSTAIGDGIAITHARHPIVLKTLHPAVTLCFLEHPIDFDADDGRPVDILFTLVSPTVRAHQQLLAELALGLKDSRFRTVLTQKASRELILEEAGRAGERISAKMAGHEK